LPSAAGPPTVGRALSRHRAWDVVVCLFLVSGLLLLPATSAGATSFVVTNIDDTGQGSLRQAILDANANPGADDITFAIDATGAQTISPVTPLPAITEQVSIDATTQPGASCDAWPPTLLVRLEGSGTVPDAPGLTASGLTVSGGSGTVIEGFIFRRFSGDGISLSSPASGTTVTCNAIGTSPDGSAEVGVTGAGVAVRSADPAATAPTTISGNIIMHNGGPGVLVDPGARLVSIRGNRIDTNLGVGIDLVSAGGPADGDGPTPNVTSGPGTGGNDLRFTPALSSALSSAGSTNVAGLLTVPSAGGGDLVIEFYSVATCDKDPAPGGFGEGAKPIGSIVLPAPAAPAAVPFVANGLGDVKVGDFVTSTVTDASGSGNTSEFSACAQVVADAGTSSADLSVSGSASPDPASGTGTITYAFTVHNDGPDPAANATLLSELAPGLELESMSSSSGECIAVVFTVTCDLGLVDPGPANAVHVTIVAVAPDVGADSLFDNHVSAQSSTQDPDDSNNELTVTSTVLARRSDLSIHKAGPTEVASGDAFSYTIDVSNAGPAEADGVTVADPLPVGVSFLAAVPNVCTEDLGTVSCSLGPLAADEATSIDLQVVADEVQGDVPVVVSNTASVASDRLDLDPANNVSEAVATSVTPTGGVQTDVELTSVLNVPNPVTGGYDLGSTATVTNVGPGDATGVTLTDTLAPGESFVAGGSDPSCTTAAGVVTCALGDVASGDDASVLIVTKTPEVAADTAIFDTFAVAAPEDGTPGNNTLDVATAVRAPRDDFVAGYVPASRSVTWLSDATQWSHGTPVATVADPTVAIVGVPGGGPGGPVTITERQCGAPFACRTSSRTSGHFFHSPHGVFGNLVDVSVPGGYDASNPITGVFLDNWSILGSGWDPFEVSYQSGGTPTTLSPCGGRKRTVAPCVSSIGRSFNWWNPYAFGDLHAVVRFTNGGTFGRGR
jgi:uncharacterized repeat protein (TIGR01451 family)